MWRLSSGLSFMSKGPDKAAHVEAETPRLVREEILQSARLPEPAEQQAWSPAESTFDITAPLARIEGTGQFIETCLQRIQELEARRQFEYKKFGVMLNYASRFRKHCYRSFILSYFGEWNRNRDCGNCSRCNANKFPRDAKFEQLGVAKQKTRPREAAQASATIVALKILSCVLRAHQKLGRENTN